MKTAWIAELTLLAGMSIYAADCGGQERPAVTVYSQGTHSVPALELQSAQSLATKMFDGIGVSLQWRNGTPRPPAEESECARRAVVLQMRLNHDEAGHPRAMAYAMPYGTETERVIHVLWDRVRETSSNEYSGRLLAHVMAHEITHILQGTSRHSASGVMKTTWTSHDYFQMNKAPLSFAPEDIELIQLGFRRWTAQQRTSHGLSSATNPR